MCITADCNVGVWSEFSSYQRSCFDWAQHSPGATLLQAKTMCTSLHQPLCRAVRLDHKADPPPFLLFNCILRIASNVATSNEEVTAAVRPRRGLLQHRMDQWPISLFHLHKRCQIQLDQSTQNPVPAFLT